MAGANLENDLIGNTLKEIFDNAEDIAALHACLTSPRGDNFRLRLLHALEVPLDEAAIEKFRVESAINEYHRHLNKLLGFKLAQVQEIDDKKQCYMRTASGEQAVNAVREFERRVGKEAAQTLYSASLGPNSIRFFLRVYGDKKEANWKLQIKYTPAEIGKLSLFLPRTIEGLSAIDKLNEADLLVYQNDNYIQMQPINARSFFQYLQQLYTIVKEL